MSFSVATHGLQICKTGTYRSLWGCDKNSGVGYFYVWISGLLTSLSEERLTKQTMPPALLRGIWSPEFLPDPQLQTGDTASKVNYGTCSFPKWIILYHLLHTFVHTLFSPLKCLPPVLHLAKLWHFFNIHLRCSLVHLSLNLNQK